MFTLRENRSLFWQTAVIKTLKIVSQSQNESCSDLKSEKSKMFINQTRLEYGNKIDFYFDLWFSS